jgi:hypothetical protein
MRRLALTLVSLVALLFAAVPQQALACIRVSPPPDHAVGVLNLGGSVGADMAPGDDVPPPAATPTPRGTPSYVGDIMDAHNDGPRWLFPTMAVALLLAATGAVVTLTKRRR